MPGTWEITTNHWFYSRTSSFPMGHIGDRHILLEKNGLLIVADVFSKYFLVRKLANSTSAAICAELATIVTELGLHHIIRSDNGPCYNSPHHPRSNGFVERMVGVAKKLMEKLEEKGNCDLRSV